MRVSSYPVLVLLGLILMACGVDDDPPGPEQTAEAEEEPAPADVEAPSGDAPAPDPEGGPDPGPEPGPDEDADGELDCDASSLHWDLNGVREIVGDSAHIEDMTLMAMDRSDIELVACDLALRIEGGVEPPMELFETSLAEWSIVGYPVDRRQDGWTEEYGRYAGFSPAECDQALVVSTLINNTDETVLGNAERRIQGGYVQYVAVCDG